MTSLDLKSRISWINKFRHSTFLQIALCLVVLDLALTAVVPAVNMDWYYRAVSPSNEPFCRKVIEYLTSSKEPDVLIVGSSFAAAPLYSCDQVILEKHAPWQKLPHMFLYTLYGGARYFQQETSRQLGRPVQAYNLGLAGSIVSDYLLVFQKMAQFHKHPQLVVLMVTPAEFIWKDCDSPKETRVAQGFQTYGWPQNNDVVSLLVNKCYRELRWHFDAIQRELGPFKLDLVNRLCQLTGHPADMYTAQLESKQQSEKRAAGVAGAPALKSALPPTAMAVGCAATGQGESQLDDLPRYRKQYQHVDSKQLAFQIESFQSILQLCRKQGIEVVVVNMPVSSQNEKLLPASVLQQYRHTLRQSTLANGFDYRDMDWHDKFSLSDFYDSAHLNAQGGQKLFDALAQVVRDHEQAMQLSSKQSVRL